MQKKTELVGHLNNTILCKSNHYLYIKEKGCLYACSEGSCIPRDYFVFLQWRFLYFKERIVTFLGRVFYPAKRKHLWKKIHLPPPPPKKKKKLYWEKPQIKILIWHPCHKKTAFSCSWPGAILNLQNIYDAYIQFFSFICCAI